MRQKIAAIGMKNYNPVRPMFRRIISLDKTQVMDFIRDRFARWWLPDDVVFIDEIPKTSVGKFDKKVLRERYQDYVVGE